jgi:hypothetical protein
LRCEKDAYTLKSVTYQGIKSASATLLIQDERLRAVLYSTLLEALDLDVSRL